MELFKKRMDKTIIPRRIFYNGKIFQITFLPEEFIIRGYTIWVSKQQTVEKVTIECHHPNAINSLDVRKLSDKPSSMTVLCLPDYIKGQLLEPKIVTLLEAVLSTWNYNNPYWKDFFYIKYEELDPNTLIDIPFKEQKLLEMPKKIIQIKKEVTEIETTYLGEFKDVMKFLFKKFTTRRNINAKIT